MKVALADKPAVPFRVPAGIKLIRVDAKTGMRAGPGDTRVILEAFKPGTAPPDNYSVIGVTADGSAASTPDPEQRPAPDARPRRAASARGCTEPQLAISRALTQANGIAVALP